MRIYYYAEAIDNLVISQTHAVSFANDGLDYIPGSVLLGALASKVYFDDQYSDDLRFALFQNNSNNFFSNAYPVKISEDQKTLIPTLPSPLCLHYPKIEKATNENYVNKIAPSTDEDHVQYKQVRGNYLSANLTSLSVDQGTITRTAIDFESQSAKDKQLFNQKFIKAGAKFLGYIECDEQNQKLIKEFFDQRVIRIGKSRSSEFGRIKIHVLQQDFNFNEPIKLNKTNDRSYIFLWAISDCQFINLDNGQPSLIPQASNLWSLDNKDDFKFEVDKSFIRTTSKRYFNRKRGGFDGDRLLVNKGSIICFSTSRDLSVDELQKLQQVGVGLDRQLGFGQVIVNPAWINDFKINKLFNEFCISIENVNETQAQNSNNKLNKYLMDYLKKLKNQNSEIQRYKADQTHTNFVKDLYKKIRVFNFIDDHQDYGSSSTQWQLVFEAAKNCMNLEDCLSKIHEIMFENIATDLNPSATNHKKKTSEIEKASWAAVLLDENKKRILFAQAYESFIRKNYSSVEHLLFDLEKLVSVDYSKFKNLKAQAQKKEIK